ncbi:uncharacterized protein LOC143836597 isoform X3 [Paroedura picta]|uniref:uncharacterized protein LOC143836597 isoform X3 n=1 Tax=Paroedura picta TaxID=143630 RepID=UPI004055C074
MAFHRVCSSLRLHLHPLLVMLVKDCDWEAKFCSGSSSTTKWSSKTTHIILPSSILSSQQPCEVFQMTRSQIAFGCIMRHKSYDFAQNKRLLSRCSGAADISKEAFGKHPPAH